MSLLDFECPTCGHVFERVVKSIRVSACPKCTTLSKPKPVQKPGYRYDHTVNP